MIMFLEIQVNSWVLKTGNSIMAQFIASLSGERKLQDSPSIFNHKSNSLIVLNVC